MNAYTIRLTDMEREFMLQLVAAEKFICVRRTQEEHLQAYREVMDYYKELKERYNIPHNAICNFEMSSGYLFVSLV